MNRRLTTAAAWACLVCLSCATAPVRDIAPGEKPASDTDEAGLWMMMERVEENLKSSGRLEADPELNRYLRGLVCRLAPELCADIRVYLVNTPHFNAAMAPNGAMQVWSGLLLRSQNEAQLSFVLGHELGHYQKRHTLKQWRTARDTSSVMVFLTLATAGAGVGFVGGLAQLAALSGLFAYSREQEREADEIGLRLMAAAGYHPAEAVRIWENLVAENQASGSPRESVFFATHPSPAERIEALRELAGQAAAGTRAPGDRSPGYAAAVGRFRAGWLAEEVRKGDPAASLVMLEQLAAGGGNPAEITYFRAEIYRNRNAAGDLERAIAGYEEALCAGGAPAAAHRSLGLLYRRAGDAARARACFARYLEAEPNAGDARMIKAYLEEVK